MPEQESPDHSLRLFLIESPNVMDDLQKRSEASALEVIGNQYGHEIKRVILSSREELERTIALIANIDEELDIYGRKDVPLCVHLGAHGNTEGLQFGADSVEWGELHHILEPLCEPLPAYSGEVILAISACNAAGQKLTDHITFSHRRDENVKPPAFLFTTGNEEVAWDDALASWSNFYYLLSKINLNNTREVQSVIDRVRSISAKIVYWRWDAEKRMYRRYSGRTPKPLTQEPKKEDKN